MTNEEIIEQLENAIDLIKQDGKDWFDERDIPILEVCIRSLIALDKSEESEEQKVTDENSMDRIVAKQVISAIEAVLKEEEGTVDDKVWTIKNIINTYDEYYQTGKKYGEWIPVSEKLPNLDDYSGSRVWQRKVLIKGYLSFDDKKELFISDAFAKDVIYNSIPYTVIIAWMPLPKL